MERELPYDVNIEDLLAEILEYMEDRSDIKDSDLGPSPNEEMRFASEIRQALFQLNKPTGKDFFTGMPFSGKSNGQSMNFDNDPPII